MFCKRDLQFQRDIRHKQSCEFLVCRFLYSLLFIRICRVCLYGNGGHSQFRVLMYIHTTHVHTHTSCTYTHLYGDTRHVKKKKRECRFGNGSFVGFFYVCFIRVGLFCHVWKWLPFWNRHSHVHNPVCLVMRHVTDCNELRKLHVSFAKEPYKREDILQKRRRGYCVYTTVAYEMPHMGWLRLVGSLNYRSLLQKSPIKERVFCKRDREDIMYIQLLRMKCLIWGGYH